MNGADVVDGVELNRMGQNMHLARYPIHWHLIGDAQAVHQELGDSRHLQPLRDRAWHKYLDVENNVTYNNIGHCFFLEDAVEHDNQFVHNLAILTKCHPDAPCVRTNLGPFGSEGGKNFDTAGQNAKDILIPPTTRRRLSGSPIRTIFTGITWPRFRLHRFLVRPAGASDG